MFLRRLLHKGFNKVTKRENKMKIYSHQIWLVCCSSVSYRLIRNSGRSWKDWTFNTELVPKLMQRWRLYLMGIVSNMHPQMGRVKSKSSRKFRRGNSIDLRGRSCFNKKSIISKLMNLNNTGRELSVNGLREFILEIGSLLQLDSMVMFKVQMPWRKIYLLQYHLQKNLRTCLLLPSQQLWLQDQLLTILLCQVHITTQIQIFSRDSSDMHNYTN